MQAVGYRNKKLRVAFHFYRQGRAAWKCDECRAKHMERARRCGFLISETLASKAPVWVRKDLVLFECPKPYVTADSLGFLENFAVWKRHRGTYDSKQEARETDAFVVLAKELSEEEERDASEVERAGKQRGLRRQQ